MTKWTTYTVSIVCDNWINEVLLHIRHKGNDWTD